MNELETQVVEETIVDETTEENEGIELTDTPAVETPNETKEVKMLSEEEVNEIVKKRLARQEEKLNKKYQEEIAKYKNTEAILNAGLETKNIDEANERLANFYKEQGINIPEPNKPGLTQREIEVLAKLEADEIIEDGISEMTREANRLADKGYKNLNDKEKVIFDTLASKLVLEGKRTELSKNGIDTKVLDDKEFNDFANKFNSKANIVEIYNLYSKTMKPQEEVTPIGSVKTVETNKTKDYYTPDEVRKLSSQDLRDPKIMEIVENSMAKWYTAK